MTTLSFLAKQSTLDNWTMSPPDCLFLMKTHFCHEADVPRSTSATHKRKKKAGLSLFKLCINNTSSATRTIIQHSEATFCICNFAQCAHRIHGIIWSQTLPHICKNSEWKLRSARVERILPNAVSFGEVLVHML